MEVLAAEFPDIFTQYIEIVPEIVTESAEVVETSSENVMSKTVQDIFLEHDYGQRVVVQEDANKNFSKTDFENTVFSTDETRDSQESRHESVPNTWSSYDQLEEILEDLRQCEEDSNSNILLSLEQEKSALGCNWTSEYSSCDHGPICPFTSRVLELDKFPEILSGPVTASVPSVVVLRNTPAGYVKVPVTEDLLRLRNMTQGYNPVKLNDITNQKSSYRPPANTVLIKVPGAGSSACQQCDTIFSDNKSLVKHTRNQHQVYQCSKCGESTVGYYRMASHAKKNHSKEPSLYCPCGRTFSEKRGLAKHQNSCVQFKNS